MYNEIKEDVRDNQKDWSLSSRHDATIGNIHEKHHEDGSVTIIVDATSDRIELDPTDFGYAFALVTSATFNQWLKTRESYLMSELVNDAVYMQALMAEDVGTPLTGARSDVIWAVSHAQHVRDRRLHRYLDVKADIVAHYNDKILENACYIYSAMYGVPIDLLTNTD